jgi:hypothetical protein
VGFPPGDGAPVRRRLRYPRRAEPGALGESAGPRRAAGRSSRRRGSHGRGRRRLRRNWWGCRRRCNGRGRLTSRQQLKRIDVPIGVVGTADAQMDVRPEMLGLAAVAESADRLALRDVRPARHRQRPQMKEGDRVAVERLDRHGTAVHRQRAREANDAGGRSSDGLPGGTADVDAAVMTRVVLASAVLERPQDGPRCGPAPGLRDRREHESRSCGEPDCRTSCCQAREHRRQASGRVGLLSTWATGSRDRGGSARRPSAWPRHRQQPVAACQRRAAPPRLRVPHPRPQRARPPPAQA